MVEAGPENVRVGPVYPLVLKKMAEWGRQGPQAWAESALMKMTRPAYRRITRKQYQTVLNYMIGVYLDNDSSIPRHTGLASLDGLFPATPWRTYWTLLTSINNRLRGSYDYLRQSVEQQASETDNCALTKTRGAHPLASAGFFLFLSAYYEALGLPPFLFASVSVIDPATDKTAVIDNVEMLCNVFFQSRLHFLLAGTYLPIVVGYIFTKQHKNRAHRMFCVYLPDRHRPVPTWYRFFIDPSAISYTAEWAKAQPQYDYVESSALQIYRRMLSPLQLDVEFQILQIPCVANLQKEYPTCAHWSSILALMLVCSAPYLLEKLARESTYVTEWIVDVSQKTRAHMDTFLRIFYQLRREFYGYMLNIVRCMSEATRPHYTTNTLFKALLVGPATVGQWTKEYADTAECAQKPRAQEREIRETLIKALRKTLRRSLRDMTTILGLRQSPRAAADVDLT